MYIWGVFVELTSRSHTIDEVVVIHLYESGKVVVVVVVWRNHQDFNFTCLSPTWKQNCCIYLSFNFNRTKLSF